MKRILVCLLIVAGILLAFLACNSSNKETDKPNDETQNETEQSGSETEEPNETEDPKETEESTEKSTDEPTTHVHSYGEWKVTKAATCTEDGSKYQECSCGDKKTEIIKQSGHNYIYGETAAQCSNCNKTLQFSQGLRFVSNGDGTCYVSEIGDCTDTDIVIPSKSPDGETVTSIGDGAFTDCTRLTSITIGNSVTSIGTYAFAWCTSLTNVTIPDSVKTIGSAPFALCYSIESISVSINNRNYHSNGNCLIETRSKTLIAGCKNSIIPDDGSVTTIGEYAFAELQELISITIPDSIINIGEYAFDGCDKLIEVINHSSLEITAGSEDHGCVAYHAIEVHNEDSNIVTYGDYLFYDGDSANYLFKYIGNDTDLVLPANYNDEKYQIWNYAFNDNDTIIRVEFSNNVTSIGKYAFSGCDGLASITIPNSVTSIGSSAFSYCKGLTSITIPNSVTSIGNSAFNGCSSLTSIEIPNSVTSIGNRAFSGCSGVTSVTIGNGVTSIGDSAFNGCARLTSVTIGSNVTDISSYAFGGCVKLVEVINHSQLEISPGSFANIWSAWGQLYSWPLEVHTGESKIVNKNGYQFYTYNGANYLLGYNGNDTVICLPQDYNGENYQIYQYAFAGNDKLTSLTIPNSVTAVGYHAFSDCYALKSISIGNGVLKIESSAFSGCNGIIEKENGISYVDKWMIDCDYSVTTAILRNGTVGIADFAFSYCSGLASIEIPNSVTSIGDYAFDDCSGLTEIVFEGTKAEWQAISKGNHWIFGTGSFVVVKCDDGDISYGDA